MSCVREVSERTINHHHSNSDVDGNVDHTHHHLNLYHTLLQPTKVLLAIAGFPSLDHHRTHTHKVETAVKLYINVTTAITLSHQAIIMIIPSNVHTTWNASSRYTLR